ncbi:MAG TPA: exosortase system-associated protein, TIGR04073 family [Verrucomicrobiae bacterium]|jgi:putative exosortase-associated protein (TIGR04073 family)|nr:exosortase system-associated protein, TIGR04073 family [Verrucomicrobiae bacterium]
MLKKFSAGLSLLALGYIVTGCAGPEEKFGRGVVNVTEFMRGGELRRAVEQSTISGESPEFGYSAGFVHGLNRSLERTGVGLYEIATFPIPNYSNHDYGPIMRPTNPVYPESYRPNWLADTTMSPDTSLGFGGGDVAPMIPGSRFRIFDGN